MSNIEPPSPNFQSSNVDFLRHRIYTLNKKLHDSESLKDELLNPYSRKTKKRKPDLVGIVILVYLCTLFISGVFGDRGLIKNYKLHNQNEAIKTAISSLERENKNLSMEIDNLTGNMRYIEKIAREELNMACENEITFVFPDQNTPTTAKENPSEQNSQLSKQK